MTRLGAWSPECYMSEPDDGPRVETHGLVERLLDRGMFFVDVDLLVRSGTYEKPSERLLPSR